MTDAQQNIATRPAQLFDTVVETLVELKQHDGPGVAYQMAQSNIRASAHFIFTAIGPQAAHRAISATLTDLEADIRALNSNSEFIQ